MKKIIVSTLLISGLLLAGCVNNSSPQNGTGNTNNGSTSGTVSATVRPGAKKGATVKVAEDQKVQWIGGKIGTTFTGTVDILPDSVIQVNTQGNILWGKMTIAMKTIQENESKTGGVVPHLLWTDFFNVEKESTAVIDVISVDYVVPEGGNTVTTSTTVTANLTIKGITKVVTFPATLTQDNDFLLLSAQLDLKIKDYDIGTSSIGSAVLNDTFTIKLNRVTFVR